MDMTDLKIGQEVKVGALVGDSNYTLKPIFEIDTDGEVSPEYREAYLDLPVDEMTPDMWFAVGYWLESSWRSKAQNKMVYGKFVQYHPDEDFITMNATLEYVNGRYVVVATDGFSNSGAGTMDDDTATYYARRGIYPITPLGMMRAETFSAETDFDVLNIEYEDENYDYPDAMQITVDVPNDFKDKHYSFTEDLIRAEIEKITGSPYKVVDFTAFYSNTPYTLRGNYDAETFEAERRNLDGTLVFTDKDFFERGPRPLDSVNKLFGYGNDILERVSWMKDKNGKIKGAKFKVWKKNAFEAETFEAREKKIGSIRIVKNPNFPSGTSLQAYIKTNRAELRKVFGNPNMGESGDGKSKGKEWNLIVGNHRVTIYDKREKDKKGTKYFNIGGSGKYGALLVAQALSIHRNERVYAKETVPQWLEDERRYQQVKSIDEHPDLTYHRAKEYEDNRRRYRAESDGFGEYTLPFVGGQRERLEDKIANQLVMLQRAALNKGNDDYLHDIFKEGLSGKPLRKMTDEELLRKNKEVEMDIDSIYGAETFEAEEDYVDYTMWIYTKSTGGLFSGEWEDGESEEQVVKEWKELVREAIEQHGDDLITADLRKHSNYDEDGAAQSSEFLFQYEHGEDNLDDFEAEDDLTFKEWADQEMMTHGGRESFDDWLDDELKSHGDNISLQDWGHHELDSHYERYGAESFEDFKRKMVGDGAVAGDVGYMEALEEFYEDYLEDFERITDEFCPEPETFEEFQERVLKNDYEMSLEAEDWGGDPKGKLATALRKAREKAKKPQKPLKIEKLDADEHRFMIACGRCGWNFTNEYIKNNTDGNIRPMYGDHCSCGGMIKRYDFEPEPVAKPKGFFAKLFGKNAETSGQWEIGEQLEEAQMNAETFEGIPQSVSDLEAVEDVRCDKYELEVNFENEDMVIVSGEELKAIMDDGWDLDSVRSFEDAGMSLLFTRNPNRAFRAEDKKRKKLSGQLSDPFDELSLDSGDWKGIVAGFGVGLLALFGYSKLRK